MQSKANQDLILDVTDRLIDNLFDNVAKQPPNRSPLDYAVELNSQRGAIGSIVSGLLHMQLGSELNERWQVFSHQNLLRIRDCHPDLSP